MSFNTVADARAEKNWEDARADYLATKEQKWKQQKIAYLEAKIQEEKAGVIDCLEQNMFSFAKAKLERIEEMRNSLMELK